MGGMADFTRPSGEASQGLTQKSSRFVSALTLLPSESRPDAILENGGWMVAESCRCRTYSDSSRTKIKRKKATVKCFTSHRNANTEAVAYIGEGRVVVMPLRTARSQEDFASSPSAFRDLAGSCVFLGRNYAPRSFNKTSTAQHSLGSLSGDAFTSGV